MCFYPSVYTLSVVVPEFTQYQGRRLYKLNINCKEKVLRESNNKRSKQTVMETTIQSLLTAIPLQQLLFRKQLFPLDDFLVFLKLFNLNMNRQKRTMLSSNHVLCEML